MFRQAARSAGNAARQTFRSSAGAASVCSSQAQRIASAVSGVQQTAGRGNGIWAAAAAAATVAGTAPLALAESREQSFVMIKPDCVHRQKIADIINRFEQRGFKLVGIKVLVPSRELAEKHYGEHKGKPFFDGLVTFLSSGPVIAMVWEGDDMTSVGRAMLGATKPSLSAPGTIRGDLGIVMGRNLCHASDSIESAQKEIALWFTPEELAQYELHSDKWAYE